jgi:hypothetical protein
VCYLLDLDHGTASWASGDKALDAWTAQFFRPGDRGTIEEFFPGRKAVGFKAQAPKAEIEGVRVDTIEEVVSDGIRATRLRVTSPRKVPEMQMRVLSPREAVSVEVEGRPIAHTKGELSLHFAVMPRSGVVELLIKTRAADALTLRIMETSYHLTDAPAFRPRPADMIRRPNTLDWFDGNDLKADFSYVMKTFELGDAGRTASPAR